MENELYGYSPIVERPPIHWPGGARAFYVGLNVEHFHLDRPSTSLIEATASLVPDALNYGWRQRLELILSRCHAPVITSRQASAIGPALPDPARAPRTPSAPIRACPSTTGRR